MRKHFISTAPLQGEKGLKKAIYMSKNEKLMCNMDIYKEGVQFPILQPMANTIEKGDELYFTTIVTEDNENSVRNYLLYCNEIKELGRKKGIVIEEKQFHKIQLPGKDSLKEQIGLFDALIKSIEPKDIITACMTFGNKPNIATLQMALEYVQKCVEDVRIDSFVYGRYPHANEQRDAEIYDYSALIYMTSIVNQMIEMKISNPADRIAQMLGAEDDI